MRVINKRFHKESPDDVYVGRPSALGNPYSHMGDTLASFKVGTRDEAIVKYEVWLRNKLEQGDKEVSGAFSLLKEFSVLVCWCSPNRCHGEVLMKLWKERNTPSNDRTNSGVTPFSIPQSLQMALELGEIKNAPNQSVATPSFSGIQEVITFAGTGHRMSKLGGYSASANDKVFRVAMRVLKGLQVKLSGPHSELGEFLKGIVSPYGQNNTNPLLHVISGMALGWDQMLALACVELGIPFTASVPLRGFQMRWPEKSIEVYESLLEEASSVVYVDELEDAKYKKLNRFTAPGLYSPIKMQTQNVHMVDNCDALLALWDGSSGGTGNCIQYANQVGKPWRNFWDFYSKEA